MKDTYISVKLIDYSTIRVVAITKQFLDKDKDFTLYINGNYKGKLQSISHNSLNDLHFFNFHLKDKFVYGNDYQVNVIGIGVYHVDLSDVFEFSDFDSKFDYNVNDLGANYSKEHTTFKVWAPLSPLVVLSILKDGKHLIHKMNRDKNGIFSITVDGDYKNCMYAYQITTSGIGTYIADPYGKGISLDGLKSVVIDTDTFIKKTKKKQFNINKPLTESVIYECSVRDITSDPNSNIVHKGKYLGLTEKGVKTNDGFPSGIDYIKSLGVDYVQLLPILDFGRIRDDKDPKDYNWGYDMKSFFCLEGSYSTNPDNAELRLYEAKAMVDAFHEEGIGVILDVVYNHIFEFENSVFEKVVPGYLFRKVRNNNRFSNASGCGNDVATERVMVRNLIVNSVNYLLDMFDIDGIRLDLMGLIDIDTIKEIEATTKAKKPSFKIYGEGWDMCNELDQEKKSVITNSNLIPHIGFFNDTFRDIVRGQNFDLGKKGYIAGDYSYAMGNVYAMGGSVCKYCYMPRFVLASQSINYIECHDNHTLFDKLASSNHDETLQTRLERIALANSIVAFSFGVPFFHMGQEVGQTKHNRGNTYIDGDKYNQLSYNMLSKRKSLLDTTKEAIKIRKSLPFLKLEDPKIISSIIGTEIKDNGVIFLTFKNEKYLPKGYDEVKYLINPSIYDYRSELDGNYITLFSSKGNKNSYKKKIVIDPISFTIIAKKGKK